MTRHCHGGSGTALCADAEGGTSGIGPYGVIARFCRANLDDHATVEIGGDLEALAGGEGSVGLLFFRWVTVGLVSSSSEAVSRERRLSRLARSFILRAASLEALLAACSRRFACTSIMDGEGGADTVRVGDGGTLVMVVAFSLNAAEVG